VEGGRRRASSLRGVEDLGCRANKGFFWAQEEEQHGGRLGARPTKTLKTWKIGEAPSYDLCVRVFFCRYGQKKKKKEKKGHSSTTAARRAMAAALRRKGKKMEGEIPGRSSESGICTGREGGGSVKGEGDDFGDDLSTSNSKQFLMSLRSLISSRWVKRVSLQGGLEMEHEKARRSGLGLGTKGTGHQGGSTRRKLGREETHFVTGILSQKGMIVPRWGKRPAPHKTNTVTTMQTLVWT